jgi:protein-disulfide isomerase
VRLRPIHPLLVLVTALLLTGCGAPSTTGTATTASGGALDSAAPAAGGPAIPVKQLPNAHYPVSLDRTAGTVLVGQPGATTTVDAYEDFLCPFCGEFERQNATAVEAALEAGTIKVRYHMLNLLDSHSEPAGYSTLSADAGLLVAQYQPSAFPAFHASLFATQPQEGDAGYTAAQLVALARSLGVTAPAFPAAVSQAPYAKVVAANLQAAENNPALQQDVGGSSGFGTPTVLVDNKIANWSQDPNWLTDTH